MTKEKIIRKPDGMRVKIMVEYSTNNYGNRNQWAWDINICEKGKRTWKCPVDTDNYDYRKLNIKERLKYIEKIYFKYINKEDVLFVMADLWKEMKPTLIYSEYVKKDDILVAMTELWEEMKPTLEDV